MNSEAAIKTSAITQPRGAAALIDAYGQIQQRRFFVPHPQH